MEMFRHAKRDKATAPEVPKISRWQGSHGLIPDPNPDMNTVVTRWGRGVGVVT